MNMLMIGLPGGPELIIILVIVVMFFGLGKLPQVGKQLGEGGELKISPVLARPFALVKSGARCSTGSVWLGDLPTAQQCAAQLA